MYSQNKSPTKRAALGWGYWAWLGLIAFRYFVTSLPFTINMRAMQVRP